MNFHIHHVHHFPEVDRVIDLLNAILTQGRQIMTTVADIQAQADKTVQAIANETTIDQSIVALVTANTAQITDLKNQLAAAIANQDPAALQAVLDQLTAAEASATANAKTISDAVLANTPAAQTAPAPTTAAPDAGTAAQPPATDTTAAPAAPGSGVI